MTVSSNDRSSPQVSELGRRKSARATTLATLAMIAFAGVIALGVVAAMVLPGYQRDVYRDRVASALRATSPLRRAVLRYRADHHAWPDRLQDLGPVMVANNPVIASITLRADGCIRLSFADDAGRLSGETLDLIPQRLDTPTSHDAASAGAVYGFVCRGGSVDTGDYPPACRDVLRTARAR